MQKDHNQQYVFIRSDDDNERLPFLTPDTDTAERRYAESPPVPGSAPLIFENGWKNEFAVSNIKEEIANILFEGVNFVVRDHVRKRLMALELPGVYLHPAVYIDGQGVWHEDFWFVAITKELDCWDRDKSTVGRKKLEIGGEVLYNVLTYHLDGKVLDAIPLENRLLFQMGGTVDGMMTCHQSIAGIFRGNGNSGAVLQPIADY